MRSKDIFDPTDTTGKRILMAPLATVIAVTAADERGGRRNVRNSTRIALEARLIQRALITLQFWGLHFRRLWGPHPRRLRILVVFEVLVRTAFSNLIQEDRKSVV